MIKGLLALFILVLMVLFLVALTMRVLGLSGPHPQRHPACEATLNSVASQFGDSGFNAAQACQSN